VAYTHTQPDEAIYYNDVRIYPIRTCSSSSHPRTTEGEVSTCSSLADDYGILPLVRKVSNEVRMPLPPIVTAVAGG
jgi:hypothetical protein